MALQNNVVNIDNDEAENSDANREAKMNRCIRYWTHEEEERLVLTVQLYIL
jgi:hypothetical protein